MTEFLQADPAPKARCTGELCFGEIIGGQLDSSGLENIEMINTLRVAAERPKLGVSGGEAAKLLP
jgi:hypothetical protein